MQISKKKATFLVVSICARRLSAVPGVLLVGSLMGISLLASQEAKAVRTAPKSVLSRLDRHWRVPTWQTGGPVLPGRLYQALALPLAPYVHWEGRGCLVTPALAPSSCSWCVRNSKGISLSLISRWVFLRKNFIFWGTDSRGAQGGDLRLALGWVGCQRWILQPHDPGRPTNLLVA